MNVAQRRRKLERFLALLALLSLVLAWWIGRSIEIERNKDFLSYFSGSDLSLVPISDGVLAGKSGEAGTYSVYYTEGTGNGYGGPLNVILQIDPAGVIRQILIKKQRETSSYLKKVLSGNFMTSFEGLNIEAICSGEVLPDGISGATSTCDGITNAVYQAASGIAQEIFLIPVRQAAPEEVIFGFAEIILILLFLLGFLGRLPGMKYRELVRWLSLLTGLIVLGFILNNQVTISKINTFLLGFWPGWRSNLYWIILLGGITGILVVTGKNVYCYWFCPFGAAQECLSRIGNARKTNNFTYNHHLKWIQRSLAWFAIIVALVFRNPGISGYEIFGGLFDLTATLPLFILLGFTMILSLFIHRPWCNYLCPMDPVFTIIGLFHGWITEIWRRKKIIDPALR